MLTDHIGIVAEVVGRCNEAAVGMLDGQHRKGYVAAGHMNPQERADSNRGSHKD